MVWSCAACTYSNASDEATTCEICTTARSGSTGSILDLTAATKRSTNGNRNMKQRNLFGAVIQTPKSRKRKEPTKKKTSAFLQAVRATAEPKQTGPSAFVEAARCAAVFSAYNGVDDPFTLDEEPSKQASKEPQKDSSFSFPTKKASIQQKDTSSSKQPLVLGSLAAQQKVMWNATFPSLWERAMENMKNIFAIDSLRNLQAAAVECALRRQSQIVVMATGGGKSLCYMLPATVLGGVTIVISPLIALMVDQVQALNDKGVSAALISSASGALHNKEVMERLLGRTSKAPKKKSKNPPNLKPITVLYGTPELCQTDRFRKVLFELHEQNRLALFAIDEAHCLSTWGHDFRPAYRKLQWLRTSFSNVPFIVCTATATSKVIDDIRSVLLLKRGEVPLHIGSFNRPNISYEVRYKQSLDAMSVNGAMGNLVELVRGQHAAAAKDSRPCSGIIYVHKRQDCEALAKEITKKIGIRAAAYHGGLRDFQRSQVQRQWTCGEIELAVATIAFGMGIDLATVRYVIHWSLAKSLEGFYQESGRAGRNGLPAISVLYYSKDEASKFSYLIQKQGGSSKKDPRSAKESVARSLDALQAMVNFCVTACCRRQYILNHFGENIDAKEVCKETCDYCQNPKQVEQRIEGSQVIQDVVNTQTGQPRAKGQRPNSPPKWDGQWSKPHGDGEDDDDDWQDTWTEGDLGITSSPDDIGMFEETPFASSAATLPRDDAGMNTNSILDKYETMEKREGSRGFVTFKSNRPQTVSIPEHLRSSNLPDPLAHLTNKKTATKPTATNPRDSDRLKAELLKLQAQREQTALRLREMQKSKSSSIAPPPPPPSLALSKKQKTERYN